jgi:transposase-like protein
MDQAEDDVLASMTFHPDHWTKIGSTNPLERLDGEIKRRGRAQRVPRPLRSPTRPPSSA